MAEVKCVISDPKTGKSYQKVLPDNQFAGQHLGATVSGSMLDLPGYELKITGASDNAGFPHIARFDTAARKKPLLREGEAGAHITRHGMIVRKTVRGKVLSDQTAQVNLAVVKHGTKSIPELLGIQEKKEEAPAEKKE